jgi:hypothetical protein
MKHHLLFLLFFVSSFCGAQNRNPALDVNRTNIWRFGTYSTFGANDVPGLDFSNGTPTVINSGNSDPRQGASTISDTSGSLLLYGGYQSLFDFTDNPMLNAGIVGDSGWIGISPSNLAVPMPKSPNLIYYFSTAVTLKYTIVDMSLNSGKGLAITRNVTLENYPVEAKLAAVHHCNGSDIWIVGHRWQTNTFYAYLLTDTGIVTTPVLTNIGPIANENGGHQAGRIKFSPNGNKVAIVFNRENTLPYLFDFDKSTGVLSNAIPLKKDVGDNGISFSSDNSKLYISTIDGQIVQYNLNAGNPTDIANSRKLVLNVFTDYGIMQLGRDGRIYVVTGSLPHRKYLTVINNPNSLDTLCHPQVDAIYLNGAQGYIYSLMNTVESYFYSGNSAYPCYGDTVTGVAYLGSKNGIQLKVYPNPFADYTTIDVSGINVQGKLEYQIIDVSGRICEAQIRETDWWDGKRLILYKARLPSGIYFLTVKTLYQSETIKLSIL